MPKFKEVILPILLITITSAIMMVAVAQLDSSAWAEGIRAEYSAASEGGEGGEGEAGGEFEGIPRPLIILAATVGSLLKITLLMGLPGLLTIGIMRVSQRIRKRSSAAAA